jgi:uncharacterized oligopeptide transporter (OPT) family protein
MRSAPELGLRPLVVGALIGAVLAASNVYTGLKTAFVDGGSITAVILGYGLLRASGATSRARQLNIVQTTASSAAVMVAVIGLAGPWPALRSVGTIVPGWALVAWGIALGTIGVAMATGLRGALIDRARLAFPTGAATAEVIAALARHGDPGASGGRAASSEHHRRLWILGTSATIAAVLAGLQQGPQWLPAVVALPIAALGPTAVVSIATSPLVLATGVMVGHRTALAIAASGLLVWMLLVPSLLARGLIASAELGDAIAWTMWPAVGLLLGEGAYALASRAASLRSVLADLRGLAETRGRSRVVIAVLGAAALTLVVVGRGVLGVPMVLTAAALVLALVLAAIIGRAAGETDVAPVGAAGALGQLAVGASGITTSLVGGSIPCGVGSQTAQGLWAFATTRALGAAPQPVVLAQLLGVVVGALVAVPTYLLLVSTYPIGSEQLPAWGAMAWRATAQAVQGSSAAPPGAIVAATVALALALLAAHRRARVPSSWVPSPTAVAIGALTPCSFAMAMWVGAAAAWLWSKRAPVSAARHGATVAAGCIAGEATIAIVLAAVMAWS